MIRLTGMASGLDTESMIHDLMSAYKGKKQKKVSTMTKYSWKMDAWSSLNKKISSFHTKSLSQLRFSTSYNSKKTTVSDATKATVTATSTAVVGAQTLAIKQMAQSGYLTGGQLMAKDASGASVKADNKTTMASLGFEGNGSFSIKTGSDEVKLNIDADTTIKDVVDQLSKAGVNANFDAASQRIFVSAKKSGAENDFSITANDGKGIEALKALGMYTSMTSAEKSANSTLAANVERDLDGNYTLTAVGRDAVAARAAELRKEYGDAAIAKQEKLDLNAEYNDANMDLQNATEADAAKYGFTETDTTDEKLKKILDYKKSDNDTKIADLDTSIAEYNTKLEQYDTDIADLEEQISKAADADKPALIEQKEKLEADRAKDAEDKDNLVKGQDALKKKQSDIDSALKLQAEKNDNLAKSQSTDITADTEAEKEILNKSVAAAKMLDADSSIVGGAKDAVRVAGQDAEIFLNGAYFSNSSNSFDINGLKIDVTGETGMKSGAAAGSMNASDYNTITLKTDIDTDGIYNMVKDFIKGYNELIKELDTLYNADSASKYDILTSEQKEEMDEDEVKNWDKKIKDSLLRRDDNLSSVINSMKNSMSEVFTINDKSYSLSTFGINTLSYFLAGDNEKGMFHIDGDADDDSTSAKEDKLKAAIAEDPEAVQEFFIKLSQKMYDSMNSLSKSSTSRSYGSFYDDKSMKTQLKTYETAISDYEKKLESIEEKYYKQFTAMEKAMTKVNSVSSQLTNMLGM